MPKKNQTAEHKLKLKKNASKATAARAKQQRKAKVAPKSTHKLSRKELETLVPDHKEHQLTLEELRFVGYYILLEQNGTEAVLAGRAKGSITRNTAASRSTALLKKEHVKDAIKSYTTRWMEEIAAECRSKVIKMLKEQVLWDPAAMFNINGTLKVDKFEDLTLPQRQCIASMERKVSGGKIPMVYTNYKLVDRHAALDRLQEYTRLFAPPEDGAAEGGLTEAVAKDLQDAFEEE